MRTRHQRPRAHAPRARGGTPPPFTSSFFALPLLALSLFALQLFAPPAGASVAPRARQGPHGPPTIDRERRPQSAVRGRVVYDDTGRPIRRALVTLLRAGPNDPVTPERPVSAGERVAGTDRDGEFEIRHVEAGRYYVLVDSPGVVSPLLAAADEDDFVRRAPTGRFGRRDFAEVTVDGLTDASVQVRARRGGVITGAVAYADGRPAAAARVAIYRLRAGVLEDFSPRAAGVTDSRGVYRVAGLPEGRYLIRAEETSYFGDGTRGRTEVGYDSGAFVFAYHPATHALSEARLVSVGLGRETAGVDVRFPARETHAVSGTVFDRRTGLPLSDVNVTLSLDEDEYDESMPTASAQVTTGADGRFRFGGVPDGAYALYAARPPIPVDEESEAREYYVAESRDVKVEGADLAGLSLGLGRGTTVSGVVVVEGRGERPEVVRLTAYADEGPTALAAPGAGEAAASPATAPAASPTPMSMLTADDVRSLLDGEETHLADSYDEKTGRFKIEGVRPGEVSLYVVAPPGFYLKALTRGRTDLLSAPLRIAEGEAVDDVRVTLGRGETSVSGRALGARGGPAGETEVALIPTDAGRRRVLEATLSTATGPDGRFEIHAPPGEYYVYATPVKEHLYLTVTEADVRARAATLLRVTLRPGERRTLDVKVTGK